MEDCANEGWPSINVICQLLFLYALEWQRARSYTWKMPEVWPFYFIKFVMCSHTLSHTTHKTHSHTCTHPCTHTFIQSLYSHIPTGALMYTPDTLHMHSHPHYKLRTCIYLCLCIFDLCTFNICLGFASVLTSFSTSPVQVQLQFVFCFVPGGVITR